MRLSDFTRTLAGGTRIEVFVRAPDVIGKYVNFRIRAGNGRSAPIAACCRAPPSPPDAREVAAPTARPTADPGPVTLIAVALVAFASAFGVARAAGSE